MWRKGGGIVTYAYYPDKPKSIRCGEDWKWSKKLQTGKWHDIKIWLKLNTVRGKSARADGQFKAWLDGEQVRAHIGMHACACARASPGDAATPGCLTGALRKNIGRESGYSFVHALCARGAGFCCDGSTAAREQSMPPHLSLACLGAKAAQRGGCRC